MKRVTVIEPIEIDPGAVVVYVKAGRGEKKAARIFSGGKPAENIEAAANYAAELTAKIMNVSIEVAPAVVADDELPI